MDENTEVNVTRKCGTFVFSYKWNVCVSAVLEKDKSGKLSCEQSFCAHTALHFVVLSVHVMFIIESADVWNDHVVLVYTTEC